MSKAVSYAPGFAERRKRSKMVRRAVLSSRQLSGLHRAWELKLSCGHTREYHMLNAPIPKTSYCGHCTRGFPPQSNPEGK